MTVFRSLASLTDLDTLLRSSHAAPVILFKHSETCGASWRARESLSYAQVREPVHEIVVQHQRGLADAVAARLGVRHESPQVLVIAAGAAVWHSSHAGVTGDRVALAHARASAAEPAATPAFVR